MNREQSLTQAEIIQMAREADLVAWLPNSSFSDGVWWIEAHVFGSELEHFAKLVAQHSANVEREECARICEDLDTVNFKSKSWDEGTLDCANAIRARRQA